MKIPSTLARYRGVVRWLATLGLLLFLGNAIPIAYGEYRNIARVPGNHVICWAAHEDPQLLPAPPTEFHSTAQGLYLTALLMCS